MAINLKNVRLAFPNLFVATQFQGTGPFSYSAQLLLPPDHPQLDELEDAITAAAKAKWGEKYKAVLAAVRGKDQVCLHNGDLKAEMDGYAGNFYLSARSPQKPLVLDKQRNVLTPESGVVYGGCYVNALVEIYANDKGGVKRINCSLKGIQFYKNGDAFAAGAPASVDDFEDIDDTGEEDDLA